MSCSQTGWLDGYFDGELDAARAAEFEAHLPGCAACVAALARRQALRDAIEAAGLYAKAPSSLRSRVGTGLVASTDQHTVKPWFDGKLDFAPPVTDLASDGFPLLGGRLDVIGGRSVAGLVYGRRKHVINVFVWPADASDTGSSASGSARGYQWVAWNQAGMRFWAVSDVAAVDLEELARLLRR